MSHFAVLVVGDDVEKQLQPFHEYECTGIKDEYVAFVDHHKEILNDWDTSTSTAYKAPNGNIYHGYEDIFYREPTKEEESHVGMGSGCSGKLGISWNSKDWGDGRGYRAKGRFIPIGFEKFERSVKDEYETIEKYAEEYHGYDAIVDGRIGTYTNPNKKWDWWKIGGRWSGLLKLKSGADGATGEAGLMGAHFAKGEDRCDQSIKSNIDFEGMRNEAAEKAEAEFDKYLPAFEGKEIPSWDLIRIER